MPPIKDIAEETGFSTATVSRALDPKFKDKVKVTTREKILRVCKKYNYSQMVSAKSLATGKSFTIGLVLAGIERDLCSPTLSETLGAIIRELRKHNYSLNILPINIGNPESMNYEVLNMVQCRGVDGFIIGSGMLREETLMEIEKRHIPVAIICLGEIDDYSSKCNLIHYSEQHGADQLALLLKAKGHNKIAYFCPPKIEKPRYNAFRKALYNIGLNFDSSDLIEASTLEIYPIQSMMSAYITAENKWEKLKKYSAIVCSTDLYAFGIAEFMKKQGVTPGKDISLAGHDNIEGLNNYRTSNPWMTTIDTPLLDLGIETVNLLLKQINCKGYETEGKTLSTKLIIRTSVGPYLNVR